MPTALLLAAVLVGLAAYFAYDFGTAVPEEPRSGGVYLFTSRPGNEAGIDAEYVTLTEPDHYYDDGGRYTFASGGLAYEAPSVTGIDAVIFTIRGDLKNGETMSWRLGLTGTARISDVLIGDSASDAAADPPQIPFIEPCDCQDLSGKVTGDSNNRFYFNVFGKLVEPVVNHGAGITYLRLPSFQTYAFDFSQTDGVLYDLPETFEATVTAGRLAAGETVTFAYPGDGLVPASRNDTFTRPHADRNPGITLQWRAKTLATLRADIVNRDEQRRAGQLVFLAGGLLGLAVGLLVEASLQLHRTRTQPRPR